MLVLYLIFYRKQVLLPTSFLEIISIRAPVFNEIQLKRSRNLDQIGMPKNCILKKAIVFSKIAIFCALSLKMVSNEAINVFVAFCNTFSDTASKINSLVKCFFCSKKS